ncbi:MAG: glycosyltransferase, partial [Hyphomicrobiaceae bacterium]|nr:glycosyltransferase [Hyphomicrobiaceae bacterium]
MKIFIVTVGSRGDVQPYVALGKGLKAAGHEVTLCASASFEELVTENGLTYAYMNDEIVRLVQSDVGRSIVENATNVFMMLVLGFKLIKRMTPMQLEMQADSWKAARQSDPDVIIYHPKMHTAPGFAEKLGVPCILALPLPMLVPTSERAAMGFPAWPLGAWYNKLTYALVLKITEAFTRRFVKRWRGEQGLPPLPRGHDCLHTAQGEQIPAMHCYSAHVSPRPSDWADWATVTGYWFLDQAENWSPPGELVDFLEAGAPPVYIGFGSISGRSPERTASIVIEALETAGERGILATGWGGLDPGDLPDAVLTIDAAPHDWLFPRVSAVVHHGGAGTTAAGLRYGKPTIVCPFFGDQPYWGGRVSVLGVGPEPIPQKKLTADKLAAAIKEATGNDVMRRKAEALAEKINAEDGIGNALAFVEKYGVRGSTDGS